MGAACYSSACHNNKRIHHVFQLRLAVCRAEKTVSTVSNFTTQRICIFPALTRTCEARCSEHQRKQQRRPSSQPDSRHSLASTSIPSSILADETHIGRSVIRIYEIQLVK